MSTLKTHNLQSPDASSANIALAPNAGMVVAGLSTYSNQINVGSNIKIGNAGVVTATSFSGDGSNLTGVVSVANQANNRLITATSTTDALYGESTLTYDGQYLVQNVTNGKIISGNDNLSTSASQVLHLRHSNLNSQYVRSETTKSDHAFLGFSLKAPNNDFQIWNQGSGGSGYGGTNSINFYQAAGSPGPYGFYFNTTQALRINTNGNIVMGNSTTSTTRLDIRFTDTTTYSASSNHPNGLKIFNDCATDNGFAGIELAATDGDDYYGSVLLKAIATGVNYSNDLAIQTRHSGNHYERFRIVSDGRFGFGTSSPSDYALATFNSANGVLLSGNGQSRILMRNNTGGTNQKMMDIQCDGNINFRTINDDYTTATTRATFRTDGNFVVGNRVGTNAPSTNQPVAFHSARVTPDTASSTLSNGVRCNLYVGSNSGWQAGDGGVIGMGGSRSGSAGQEAMWGYIKGSRQSGNGWEYAGRLELGTAEWGTYNTTKAMTIFADNQVKLHGDDSTMMAFDIGGATRLIIEHTGGGNMRLRNLSSGTVTYSTSSDYRLKEKPTTINNALSTIKSLKPYQFIWKHDNKLGQGFFAHEAKAVLPDVGIVSGKKDEVRLDDDTKHDGQWKKNDPIYQSIDYSKLVPLLTAALQEETAKREALEARVAALEGS